MNSSPTPPTPRSRRALLIGGGLAAAAVAGGGYWVGTSRPAVAPESFAGLSNALRTLEALRAQPRQTTSGWDMAQVLHHAAQSIEYSMDGFPAPKPVWFRTTVGTAAFAVFSARGRMNHDLHEPIPGAPAIAAGQALLPAVERASEALRRFDRHSGPLAPHFAYGVLSKPDFERAHLMHFANHWQLVREG